LPFTNLSGDSTQEYFSDGLTDEMIAQLGRLGRGRIGVIARWSSMVFKGANRRAREIGEALRADYLLEGSVRREGDKVRITAWLVRRWTRRGERSTARSVSTRRFRTRTSRWRTSAASATGTGAARKRSTRRR